MDTIPGAGATIGLLERIVMSICIIFNQFASIGLVLLLNQSLVIIKFPKTPHLQNTISLGHFSVF